MTETRVTRRLAAIVAADVVGYSRLIRADEEGTIARLKALRRDYIDSEIKARGGRIVKLMGDGMLVEFVSVVEAIHAACEIQRSLAARNGRLPEAERILLRIGVNLGDVVIDGDDIQGDGVNIAARLETLADPGGLCVSDHVHDEIKNRLSLSFEDMGEQQVKNIDEPVRVWRWHPESGPATASEPNRAKPATPFDRPSVLVLPFANMSGDAEQEYFADGVTEDIITELSRFDGLFVIARNTAMTFKGKTLDVPAVASQLGIGFVLEGSVRKLGERIRITTQLIDGRKGDHIWAERYDGTLAEVFELQENVTRQVVGSIVPEITEAELARLDRGERVYDDAHDLAWQAKKQISDALNRGDARLLDQGIATAQRALEKGPHCVAAYVALCEACQLRQLFGWAGDPAANRALAERAAAEVIARAPRDYRSYFSHGCVEQMRGRFGNALADFKRALGLNPNDAMVLQHLAWAEASAGEVEAAKAHAHLSIRLSPRDRWIGTSHLALSMAALIEGDLEATRHWAELAILSHPTAPIRRALMIACAGEAGDEALAREHLDFLTAFAPDFIPSLFRGENPIFHKPEYMDLLLGGLRKAGLSDRTSSD